MMEAVSTTLFSSVMEKVNINISINSNENLRTMIRYMAHTHYFIIIGKSVTDLQLA
jgi:hypothetical protein